MFKLRQRHNRKLRARIDQCYYLSPRVDKRERSRPYLPSPIKRFFFLSFPSSSTWHRRRDDAAARNRIRGGAPQFGAARLQEPREGARMWEGRHTGSLPRWIPGATRAHDNDGLSARGGAAVPCFPDPYRKFARKTWIKEIPQLKKWRGVMWLLIFFNTGTLIIAISK